MLCSNSTGSIQKPIQLEIDFDKLKQLFEQGVICASELRCLNTESKQAISHLCLTSCAQRIHHNFNQKIS